MAIGDNEEEIPRIAAVPPTTTDSVRSSNSSLTVVNRQERGEREAVSMIVGMSAYPSYNYKLPIIFPSRCSHPPGNGCARGASSSRGPGSTPPWRRGAASDSLGARSPGTAATRIKIATVIMKSVLSSQLFDKNLLFIICLHLINNRNL